MEKLFSCPGSTFFSLGGHRQGRDFWLRLGVVSNARQCRGKGGCARSICLCRSRPPLPRLVRLASGASRLARLVSTVWLVGAWQRLWWEPPGSRLLRLLCILAGLFGWSAARCDFWCFSAGLPAVHLRWRLHKLMLLKSSRTSAAAAAGAWQRGCGCGGRVWAFQLG